MRRRSPQASWATSLLLPALTLCACAPKVLTVHTQTHFKNQKYCGPRSLGPARASSKALTKTFNISCLLYERQAFTFVSKTDTQRLLKMFGGKVEQGELLTSVSGLTLPTHKLSLPRSEVVTPPDVVAGNDSFFYLGTVAFQLFTDPQTLSQNATLSGAGPIHLQDGDRNVTFDGEGESLVRDVYSAAVGRALKSWRPYTAATENVQGAALSPLRHQIRTGLPPQTVVALVIRTANSKVGNTPAPNFFYEVTEVGTGGVALFGAGISPQATTRSKPIFTVTRLQLKGSLNAMQPATSEIPTEADAVVIPVSGVPLGQIGQKAVTPVSPLSVAR